MQTKVCSKCKVEKPHSEYFKDNGKGRKIRCRCKSCCSEDIRNWRVKNRSEYNSYAAMWRSKNPERQHKMEIKRRYLLSIEDYNAMLTKQECKCKICGKNHDPSKSRGRLYVDHCHDSKLVRGLLCSNCNTAIGNLKESPKLLRSAAEYLESQTT